MAAIKYTAGLILAFILGMSIMILFYELSSQPNPSTPRNAEESLSLYDYAQIICIEDSPIWRPQDISADGWEDLERIYARTYTRMSQIVPPPSMKSYHDAQLEMNSILRHQAEQYRRAEVNFDTGTDQFLQLAHRMVSIMEEETKKISTGDRLWLVAYGC